MSSLAFSPATMLPSPPHFRRAPTPFTPTRSSPLTPKRHPNTQQFCPLSPPESPPSLLKFAEIKRTHKPNPLFTNKEDDRERRRKLFMRKLSNARDDKRMEARGGEEEIMRTILVSEKRRWQNQLARAAAQIPTIEEETELELENPGYQTEEDLLREQDLALEAILEQLDLADHEMDDVSDNYSSSHQASHQPQQQNLCSGCGQEDTIVPVANEHVCFCCGWSPPE